MFSSVWLRGAWSFDGTRPVPLANRRPNLTEAAQPLRYRLIEGVSEVELMAVVDLCSGDAHNVACWLSWAAW